MGLVTKPWESFSDEELLNVRVKDLGLSIQATPLQRRITAFRRELRLRGILLQPQFYLGDEWFSPEGELAISIPFYLAHPRLQALERQMMHQVEGGTAVEFRRILRHELGHCFDHAHGFSSTRLWRRVFGDPRRKYQPERYAVNLQSRRYVKHLPGHYAQAHPDEDFAETFAVWLGSAKSKNRLKYATWPVAWSKIQYVESLAQKYGGKPMGGRTDRRAGICRADRMGITLKEYYTRRKNEESKSKKKASAS
ncbi:MAG: putative zinc-binding metallopeptidase [Bdellovibrionota bacterium]